MKHCSDCQTDKDESEFYVERKRPGGLAGRCKECDRARNKRYWREQYYPANAERLKGAVVQRRREKRALTSEAGS